MTEESLQYGKLRQDINYLNTLYLFFVISQFADLLTSSMNISRGAGELNIVVNWISDLCSQSLISSLIFVKLLLFVGVTLLYFYKLYNWFDSGNYIMDFLLILNIIFFVILMNNIYVYSLL